MSDSEKQLTLSNGLGLEFFRSGDRWQHRIVCHLDSGSRFVGNANGAKFVVLESYEGDHENPWPPSPPFQELDRMLVDDRPVIFGVGRAGKAHWSASFSSESSDSSPAIFGDIACSFQLTSQTTAAGGGKFQSCYTLGCDTEVVEVNQKTARFRLGDRILKVTCSDCHPYQTIFHFSDHQFVIETEPNAGSSIHFRWGYRMQLEAIE